MITIENKAYSMCQQCPVPKEAVEAFCEKKQICLLIEVNEKQPGTINIEKDCPKCNDSMEFTDRGWSCLKCKSFQAQEKSSEKKLLLDVDEKARTVTFYENNNIRYGQDMRYFQSIPPNVPFIVEKRRDGYYLIGEGYGIIGGNYGNGGLYVLRKYLDYKIKECLEVLSKPTSKTSL